MSDGLPEGVVLPRPGGATLRVRVTPNARKASITLRDDGTLQVRVQAPAVEGAANAALVRWVARELLGVPRGAVRIAKGERSREKLLEVDAPPEDVRRALCRALGA